MGRRTDQDYITEADGIVTALGDLVWYTSPPGRFLIYRKGMGLIGRRTSARQLVLFLRNQVPSSQLRLTPPKDIDDADKD